MLRTQFQLNRDVRPLTICPSLDRRPHDTECRLGKRQCGTRLPLLCRPLAVVRQYSAWFFSLLGNTPFMKVDVAIKILCHLPAKKHCRAARNGTLRQVIIELLFWVGFLGVKRPNSFMQGHLPYLFIRYQIVAHVTGFCNSFFVALSYFSYLRYPLGAQLSRCAQIPKRLRPEQ